MKIILLPENSCLADSLMIRIPGILDPPLLYTASFICILPGRPRTVWMKTWNPTTSPWMKQLTWLVITRSGDWCLRLALHTPSSACHKRTRGI